MKGTAFSELQEVRSIIKREKGSKRVRQRFEEHREMANVENGRKYKETAGLLTAGAMNF